ncbi:hypothetical protein [Spiroplasma monobiae]|uniref:Uncharacterized protein n=1 Tax=Spiroplasma monobiae MQ-1 TaxID=1336748 RepID=A0A2K9LU67_SPISQ|nr:hypothetical protein [Spiroplasma monobiae]AUM62609.1 hypothetical protein SMONO_v1c03600 [Spiroplasma monobiae MQ-1]
MKKIKLTLDENGLMKIKKNLDEELIIKNLNNDKTIKGSDILKSIVFDDKIEEFEIEEENNFDIKDNKNIIETFEEIVSIFKELSDYVNNNNNNNNKNPKF